VSFRVRLTRAAAADLARLYDFSLDRELRRGAGTLDLADQALAALRSGIATLKTSPFTCRKATSDAFLRELVVSFGHAGYVVLFEIEDATTVTVLAVRHQLEDDYH
jgi:plasmid stabilization system protein ParE